MKGSKAINQLANVFSLSGWKKCWEQAGSILYEKEMKCQMKCQIWLC